MARGKLDPKVLDDRTWQQIVDQAKALIPIYAPSWTDHNASDPGIALIELFAWMVEGMIYRLNNVPDRSLVELLNLIGITRDPATPASTYLTFTLKSGDEPLPVEKGFQVATRQSERETAHIFETDEAVRVLPMQLNAALYLYAPAAGTLAYANVTSQISAAPLKGLQRRVEKEQTVLLALGFKADQLPDPSEQIRLRVRFPRLPGNDRVLVSWGYSKGSLPPLLPTLAEDGTWAESPVDLNDMTLGFQKNGIVAFPIPQEWSAQEPSAWAIVPEPGTPAVGEKLFWVGVRITNQTGDPLDLHLAHILFNSVPATNALTIPSPELLGRSNGGRGQRFALRYQPVYKQVGVRDPYAHLHIEVEEAAEGTERIEWQRVDEFPEGAGRYYRLHPVTGEIEFGDHNPTTSPNGHGSIPPTDAEIYARTYRYVAGDSRANVPSGTIIVPRTAKPGLSATNPGAATGGSDEEPIEETKRRAPLVLRNRDRAVTAEDYEYLAREATTDVKKARALPERLRRLTDPGVTPDKVGLPYTFGGLNRDKGMVNVIILPDAPVSDPTPMPPEELIKEVSDYLHARRVLATGLHVTYPRYLPINVTVDVKLFRNAANMDIEGTINETRAKMFVGIRAFLHPLHGGPTGTGWEVGQGIGIANLLEFIQLDPETGFISNLVIKADTPLYTPPERPELGNAASTVWIQLADYEIVCSGTNHVVNVETL